MLKRLFAALAVLAAAATSALAQPPVCTAPIPVQGTQFLDQFGNPLASGLVTFTLTDANNNPVTYTVQGGSPSTATFSSTIKNGTMSTVTNGQQFTVPCPATTSPSGILYRVVVTDPTGSAMTYLTLPQTPITGPNYSLNSYIAPAGITISGYGFPRTNLEAGAQYTDTSAVGGNTWVGSQLQTDKSVVWTQNPSSSPQCGLGYAIAQQRAGAPYCIPSQIAWAEPGYSLGSPLSGAIPGPVALQGAVSDPEFNIVTIGGAKCNGTDDSAAIQLTMNLAFALDYAWTAPYPSGPRVTGCPNGNKAYFATTLNVPMNIILDGLNLQALPALGTQTGLKIQNVGIQFPGGAIQNSTIAGCGSGCTGSLIEGLGIVGYSFKNDNISSQGGKCINLENSERVTLDSSTEIGPCEQGENIFAASNEIWDSSKCTNNGAVTAIEGNPAYTYSVNAPGGVPLAPGSGGTLVPLYPVTYRACRVIDGATIYHMPGPGSTKGSFDTPMVWSASANVDLDGTYLEQSHISPSVIVGGPIIYTTTTQALTSTTVTVSPNSNVYNAVGVVVATQPTNQLQHYWFDAVSDAVAAGDIGNFCFWPPDFIQNSSASSSLGGGILKGQYLCYPGSGYAGVAAQSLVLSSLTPVSGCSNPSANPATTCTQHNALTWPAGAITGEPASGAAMAIRNGHLAGFEGPSTGYSIANDNSGPLVAAEAEVGLIPDPFQVNQGTNSAASSLVLDNDEMFTGFTQQPGVGLFAVHTSSIITLQGQNSGTPSTQNDDTLSSVNLDPYFLFGPNGVEIEQYTNGTSAQLVLRDAGGERTISSTQGFLSQSVAVVDPTTMITSLSKNCFPGCSLSTKVAPPVIAAPTVNPTGGTITAGTNGQNLAFAVAYVNPTAYLPTGYETVYTNATISAGGSAYTLGPKVSSAGTKTATITEVQLVAPSGATVTTAAANTFALGDVVDMTGMVRSTADQQVNIALCTVTSTGNPFGCTFQSVTVSNSVTNPEVGNVQIPYCPGWYTTASIVSGAVVQLGGIGGTSAALPGLACTVAPGTSINLRFSNAVGDTTGSGAAGTDIIQGSYGSSSVPQVVNVASGTTNSITVPSPGADAGGALYEYIYGGPPGQMYNLGLFSVGSHTITAINYAPTSATQSFMPRDCAYECNPDTVAGFTQDATFNFRHWNAALNKWVDDAVYTGGASPTFAFTAPVLFTSLTDGCLYTVSHVTHSTGTTCGSSGAGITLTTTGTSGAATLTGTTLNIPVYSSGGGSGSVTTFGSGNLSPLFTTSVANPTTTPAQTFTLSNAAAYSILGNPSGSAAAPGYTSTPIFQSLDKTHFYVNGAPSSCTVNYPSSGSPTSSSSQKGCAYLNAALYTITNHVSTWVIDPCSNNIPLDIEMDEPLDTGSGSGYGTPTVNFWGCGGTDTGFGSHTVLTQATVNGYMLYKGTGYEAGPRLEGVWFDGGGYATQQTIFLQEVCCSSGWFDVTVSGSVMTGPNSAQFQVIGGSATEGAPEYGMYHVVARATGSAVGDGLGDNLPNVQLSAAWNGTGGLGTVTVNRVGTGIVNGFVYPNTGDSNKVLPVEIVASPTIDGQLPCLDPGLLLYNIGSGTVTVVQAPSGCPTTGTPLLYALDNTPTQYGALFTGQSDITIYDAIQQSVGSPVYSRGTIASCAVSGSSPNYQVVLTFTGQVGYNFQLGEFAQVENSVCASGINGKSNDVTAVSGSTVTLSTGSTNPGPGGTETGTNPYVVYADDGYCMGAQGVSMNRAHGFYCQDFARLGSGTYNDMHNDTNLNYGLLIFGSAQVTNYNTYLNQTQMGPLNNLKGILLATNYSTATIQGDTCGFSIAAPTNYIDIAVPGNGANQRPDRFGANQPPPISSNGPCNSNNNTPFQIFGDYVNSGNNLYGGWGWYNTWQGFHDVLQNFTTQQASSTQNYAPPGGILFTGSGYETLSSSTGGTFESINESMTIGTGTNPLVTLGIHRATVGITPGQFTLQVGDFNGGAGTQTGATLNLYGAMNVETPNISSSGTPNVNSPMINSIGGHWTGSAAVNDFFQMFLGEGTSRGGTTASPDLTETFQCATSGGGTNNSCFLQVPNESVLTNIFAGGYYGQSGIIEGYGNFVQNLISPSGTALINSPYDESQAYYFDGTNPQYIYTAQQTVLSGTITNPIATVEFTTTNTGSGSAQPVNYRFTGNSLGVGSSPPTALGSATGGIAFTEGSTAGTPTASQDYCRADATTHQFLCSLNNSNEFVGIAQPFGSETVSFATTPTFSLLTKQSVITLTSNITSFTLGAGFDGQEKVLIFCQNGTGSFTVTAPTNVHGFATVGTTASKCSSQHFTYVAVQTAWLAAGVINQ